MNDGQQSLAEIARGRLIGQYHRHVFLCIGEDCCTKDEGEAAWEALKKELKDHHISLATGPHSCYRTKVQCLRVCSQGPILVVYPEGTYYSGMTADRIPEFVREHLLNDRPMESLVFARNPLPLIDTAS